MDGLTGFRHLTLAPLLHNLKLGSLLFFDNIIDQLVKDRRNHQILRNFRALNLLFLHYALTDNILSQFSEALIKDLFQGHLPCLLLHTGRVIGLEYEHCCLPIEHLGQQ